jgi:hypothetical protein
MKSRGQNEDYHVARLQDVGAGGRIGGVRWRRKSKASTARYERENTMFEKDLLEANKLMNECPEFKAFSMEITEKFGLDPVPADVDNSIFAGHELPDYQAWARSADSPDDSGRIIPEENNTVQRASVDLTDERGEGGPTHILAEHRERQQQVDEHKKSVRGQRLRGVLEAYFRAPPSRSNHIMIRPAGYTQRAFSLSAVGLDIVSVAQASRGLYIVTWATPDPDLARAGANARASPGWGAGDGERGTNVGDGRGAHLHNYRRYVASPNYNREALTKAIEDALKVAVGRIRYHVGLKMNLKRVPELRFKNYSVRAHQSKATVNQLIDSLKP